MRKIGILTYFWADNPGTFLQAYSMVEALKKRFPTDRVELVNCRHRRVYFRPSRGALRIGQLIKDIKRYALYRSIQKRYLTKSPKCLITHDSERSWEYIENQHYDLIVVGADTILQLLPFHFRDGRIPIYWLPPKLDCKKVACAASSGALTYEQLSGEHRKALRASLGGFDLIGIRDDATYALIKACGLTDESKLEMTPDPTVGYEIDYSCVERLIRRKKPDLSRPMVVLNVPKSFSPAADLAAYYKSKGYQILSPVFARYSDINLTDMTPFEWAGLFKYASLVVADRFHVTLFSLRNFTPVVAVDSDRRRITEEGLSKTRSLAKQFGLEQTNYVNAVGLRDAEDITRITDATMKNFNKHQVREKVKQMENQFNSFVDKIPEVLD